MYSDFRLLGNWGFRHGKGKIVQVYRFREDSVGGVNVQGRSLVYVEDTREVQKKGSAIRGSCFL